MSQNTTPRNEITKNPAVQGAHVLKSYLKALRIPHTVGAAVGEVVVSKKGGGELKVRMGLDVNPADITSFELDKSLAALHTVTEAAGYGRPMPINRGDQPAGRVNYNDNFEDVYMRHSLFRRSPNVSEAEMEPYTKTIKQCARRAMYKWKTVFAAMGFDENDLANVCRVYTTGFIHHYATSDDLTDNIRLLTEFLNQRLGELAKISHKKALNSTCLPQHVRPDTTEDGEASYVESYAESEDSSPDEEYAEDTFHLTFPNGEVKTLRVENDGMLGLRMHLGSRTLTKHEANQLTEQIRKGIVKKAMEAAPAEIVESEEAVKARREKARAELNERLMSMTPEQRTVALGYAALSRDYAPDARREARRLADELACPKCQKKVASGTICMNCNVQAVPRYGVDYMAFREKLVAENHPMAEAMSANIPESEARARAKRPAVAGVKSLADTAKDTEQQHVEVKPIMSKAEMIELSQKMHKELMAKLPTHATCPKCKQHLTREAFGVRVAKDKETGLPTRASRQSYCIECRKADSKLKNATKKKAAKTA